MLGLFVDSLSASPKRPHTTEAVLLNNHNNIKLKLPYTVSVCYLQSYMCLHDVRLTKRRLDCLTTQTRDFTLTVKTKYTNCRLFYFYYFLEMFSISLLYDDSCEKL